MLPGHRRSHLFTTGHTRSHTVTSRADSSRGLIVGPLGGQLSDRTRTRLGRRRPWVIGGTVVGVVGLIVMAASPNVLGLGWVNYTLLYLTAAVCTAIGGTLVLRIKSVR